MRSRGPWGVPAALVAILLGSLASLAAISTPVAVLAPMVALLGQQAVAQQHAQHGAAGHGPAASAPGAGQPLYNHEDLLFLQHMIVHHAQALDMAVLVPERTARAEFIRFADYVARAQAAEIAFMRSLLEIAAARGLEIPDHGPHGDPPMAGMLSRAQMEALAVASGPEFERLWLEGMIYHHQGALDMAQAQQLQQLENGRRPYGIDVLVEEIIVEQRADITKMRGWLEEWGLTDGS